jgi:hypothetical protein
MIPIQLLTLGHTVRVCYDLTNYAELSINSNGDLTIHKLVGGSPKIIDKRITGKDIVSLEVDSFGHPLNTPPTDRPLKVGDVLVYTDESDSFWTNENEYIVIDIIGNLVWITNDNSTSQFFNLKNDKEDYYKNYFTLKP